MEIGPVEHFELLEGAYGHLIQLVVAEVKRFQILTHRPGGRIDTKLQKKRLYKSRKNEEGEREESGEWRVESGE